MSGVRGDAELELGKVSGWTKSLKQTCQLSRHDPPQTTKGKDRLASTSSNRNMITGDGQWQWVKTWQRVEVGVICVVIAIVWVLLSLPIIFYHIPPDYGENAPQVNNMTGGFMQSCAVYNGTICAEPLQSLQNCLPDKELNLSELYVSPNKSQAEVEEEAQLILTTGLGILNPSPACTAALVPFLCLNLFKLCDSNGTSYLPSSSECVDLRSGTCVEIWDAANGLLVSIGLDPLPICESLPETSISCEANSDSSGHPDSSNGTNSSIQCTRHCRDGFYCVDDLNICLPRCDKWEMYSRTTVVAYDVAVILSAIVNLVAGTLVLVISCIRRKKMFIFPSVFVVYMAITMAALGIFYLVQYIDRPGLYCSSVDLEESIDNSTPFCNIDGFVFHYTVVQLTMWWFFHLIALFWKIRFPFHAKSFDAAHRFKYLHIAAVILGVVLPAIPAIIMSATGGFVIRRFPPVVCLASDLPVTFYSVIVPIIIMVQIGISLLVIIFWTIHKHHGLLKAKQSKHPIKIGTAERKILIVFCYYVVFTVIAITGFTLDLRDSDKVIEEITEYFYCESLAPEDPCDTSFREFAHTEMTALATALLHLFPTTLLVFVISVKDVKNWCTYVSSSTSEQASTSTTSTSFKRSRKGSYR